MNSWLRKRVLVFTGTLCLWDIDGRIAKLNMSHIYGSLVTIMIIVSDRY
jgi:hypothetical protein